MEKLCHYSALPLLIILAAFSSKDRFPDNEISIVSSWLLLFVFGFIFIKSFKFKIIALLIIVGIILVRILALFNKDIPQLVLFSSFLYMPVVIVSGVCIAIKNNIILIKQIKFFTILSIALSLLQIHGVLMVQEFGSASEWKIVSDVPLLFVKYTEDFWAGMTQTRPDGLTHANNLTSQILLFFYSWLVIFKILQPKSKSISNFYIFAISFACAINAGKVIVLGIACLLMFVLIQCKNNTKKLTIHIIIPTFAGYLLYAALYPGLFVLNFDQSVFFINLLGRAINIGVISDNFLLIAIGDYLSKFQVDGVYSTANQLSTIELLRETSDAFSGLGSIIKFIPIIMPFLIFILVQWRRKLYLLDLHNLQHIRILAPGICIVLIASIFGGPFITTVWFMFFLSSTLIPLIIPYISTKYLRTI